MPRPVRMLVLAALVPAIAAGCGGGDDARTAAPTPTQVSSTPSVRAPSPTPRPTRPSTRPTPRRTTSPTPRATHSPTPRRTTTHHAASTSGRYTFPVRCSTSYAHSHHDYPATDIFADRGCPFVAPTDGRVDEVGRTDNWDPHSDRGQDRGGRFVSVVGTDG